MRCYNGCPDDELAAVISSRDAARREAQRLGYAIVWFPAEGKWSAALRSDWSPVGEFCDTAEECLVHVKQHHAQEATS